MRARSLCPLLKARAFRMIHRRNGFKLTHCRKLSGLLSFDWPRFVVNHTVLNDEKFHVAVLALCSGEQDRRSGPGVSSLLVAVRALEHMQIESERNIRQRRGHLPLRTSDAALRNY